MVHPYINAVAALPTKHKKGLLIAPTFAEHLKMQIVELDIDTDQLGTFSGEIERTGSAREVVIRKAQMGISSGQYQISVASEGTIGADPFIPFINSDIEFMALVDQERALMIVESHRSTDIVAHTLNLARDTELEKFLAKADFPNHHLIVRAKENPNSFCVKGINNKNELDQAIFTGLKDFPELVIESDLRAHCSPSRQKNIATLAEKLAIRLSNLCPGCAAPGWGLVSHIKGVPCHECGEISEAALAQEIQGCGSCDLTKPGKVLADSIDPAQCQLCNP